jgi:hypothetical protein
MQISSFQNFLFKPAATLQCNIKATQFVSGGHNLVPIHPSSNKISHDCSLIGHFNNRVFIGISLDSNNKQLTD